MSLVTLRKSLLVRQARLPLLAALLAIALALAATPVLAAERYVFPGSGNVANCTTPAAACDTISAAIADADPGDEIRVAEGSYSEPEILVNKDVTIIGSFDVDGGFTESNVAATPTILDGEGTHRLFRVTANGAEIRNFILRNGNATTSANNAHRGGGILIVNATTTLEGLTIRNNVASDVNVGSMGGGIAFLGNGTLEIRRSLILSNTTLGLGGGVAINPAAGQDPIVNIRASVIAHNAAGEGGAFATGGSGRSIISFFHTTMADNNAGTTPADEAIFMTGGEAAEANSLNFSHSLLTGNNTALRSNTAVTPQMLSTGLLMDPGVVNDWEGNVPVLNPATRRPLPFANPAAGDYHLVAGSPAIDIAGNTAKVDIEGRQRVNSSDCTPFSKCPLGRSDDYGAYEFVYSAPVIRYVSAQGGSDAINNCMNSALPCATLENANKIVLGGDEIRVAIGEYTDGDSTCANSAIICVRQGITLTGGFTTTNWNTPSTNPALTVLNGQDTRQGIQVDYDYPEGSALLQNFSVRNGYSLVRGGGIAVNTNNIGPAQNLTIRNCRVEDSRGDNDGDGGGIFALAPVGLVVQGCTLSGNSVPDGRGGGLAITDANGVATYTLSSLLVFNNQANRPDETSVNGGRGGGIFLEGVGTLRESEVYRNSATFSGGGVSTGSNGAHPTLDRLYIYENEAGVGGGFSIFLTGGANLYNSLLVGNKTSSAVGLKTGQTGNDLFLGGNAIHTPDTGVPDEPLNVINVTIADNVGAVPEAVAISGLADEQNSRIHNFVNVLISGNEVGIKSDAQGEAVANLTKVLITNDVTTKVQGFTGARLTGAPLNGVRGFVGPDDYRLKSDADGVDDGDTVPGIVQDLNGESRPAGPAFDIGAYETTSVVEKQNQTITFAAITNKVLADSPLTVQPTSSSNLPVMLTSETLAVCTVAPSGNSYQITLLAEGTCRLRANQPGNATFNAAPAVTRSFEVGADVVPKDELRLPALEKQP